ncbi:MAG: hypothetical protein QOJ84_3502 [Bradyrhizobium sp.]|jgi:hypothetical protein|nr:hypothetical protein [Bradyrhizobium sp.]
MQIKATAQAQRDLFNLKNVSVELVSTGVRPQYAFLTIGDLEAIRVGRRAIPASKHGLESICGASCEIGAH